MEFTPGLLLHTTPLSTSWPLQGLPSALLAWPFSSEACFLMVSPQFLRQLGLAILLSPLCLQSSVFWPACPSRNGSTSTRLSLLKAGDEGHARHRFRESPEVY